jgi:hypothetical protein
MMIEDDDAVFRRLLSKLTTEVGGGTPASMKARLYSALVRAQQATGPLASLNDTVASGRDICVFEKLVQIAPLPERAKSPFFCHTCHARLLAEHFDHPPIFWPHCPYADFKKS